MKNANVNPPRRLTKKDRRISQLEEQVEKLEWRLRDALAVIAERDPDPPAPGSALVAKRVRSALHERLPRKGEPIRWRNGMSEAMASRERRVSERECAKLLGQVTP